MNNSINRSNGHHGDHKPLGGLFWLGVVIAAIGVLGLLYIGLMIFGYVEIWFFTGLWNCWPAVFILTGFGLMLYDMRRK